MVIGQLLLNVSFFCTAKLQMLPPPLLRY